VDELTVRGDIMESSYILNIRNLVETLEWKKWFCLQRELTI